VISKINQNMTDSHINVEILAGIFANSTGDIDISLEARRRRQK